MVGTKLTVNNVKSYIINYNAVTSLLYVSNYLSHYRCHFCWSQPNLQLRLVVIALACTTYSPQCRFNTYETKTLCTLSPSVLITIGDNIPLTKVFCMLLRGFNNKVEALVRDVTKPRKRDETRIIKDKKSWHPTREEITKIK